MDIYDEQIARLTKNPLLIKEEWSNAIGFFDNVGDPVRATSPYEIPGCLTQIRAFKIRVAHTRGELNVDITQQIKDDERIPTMAKNITPAILPVFAEWRRKIDQLNSN